MMEKKMSKVGIVIINFNSTNYLKLTLESLLSAKTSIPYEVGVIDNGSVAEEREACEDLLRGLEATHPAAELCFFDAGKNLGFSGGNNVVIRHFLEKKDVTHICLLNSDVIVTDYWLDYLVGKDKDVIGPVTNAAGNEQTIQIDYTVQKSSEDIPVVGEYASKRHICYQDYAVESDLVTFFATVFRREVIEEIGLLDERFYPGSYEDDDYCKRILQAGYHIWIARDCFLHHYGSGSFSKLNMNERKNIGNVNRERFERKWNCKWEDRTWKLLKSCRQDVDFLLKKQQQEWPRKQLDSSLEAMERLLVDWGAAIQFFTTQSDSDRIAACNYSARQLMDMLWEKVKGRLGRAKKSAERKAQEKLHRKENQKAARTGMERIYELMEQARKDGHQSICVFAPMYNKENEKDGYVQRIKAIDNTVLKDMCRVYLYDEGTDCVAMRFDFIDPLHGYIVFNSHNPDQLQEILKLVRTCGKTYTHSILRFMEDRTDQALWQIFDYEGVRHIWDMHGTVPEEYALSGSELGSQLANHVESVMAYKVDVVVVVTEAMGNYLRKKYPSMQAQIIVLPILNQELLEPAMCEKGQLEETPTVVYAGGLQPWQNIDLMQDVMNATGRQYRYKIFVPQPEEFLRLWGNRTRQEDMKVESRSPEELYREYEDCDFGFVLRDDSPVNYVACPTKIIEYLRFGIIPILKSTEIGDFLMLGMEYIPYTDLLSDLKLSEEKRQEMVKANYGVLDKLKDCYRQGVDHLKQLVELSPEQWKKQPPAQVTGEGEKAAIGLVVTTFDKGGLEQVVLNLYLGYKREGHPVYLLCQEDVLGVMAGQIAQEDLLPFRGNMGTFLNYLYQYHITVLHYHYNVFGCMEAKERGVHTIYTMHNVYTWKNDQEIMEYSKQLSSMDKVIPVSGLVKNYYLQRTGADEGKLRVICNGIDFQELQENQLPEYLERPALGLQPSDVVIAFVASFYPVKYQIGMIGVMETLIEKYPQVKLLFVGNSENYYYQEFRKVYEESTAREHMQVVPYFEHRFMGAFLRQVVDIFTLPTLQEGCSNAVLEAIYCDRPMVLTNVGNAMDVSHLAGCEVVPAAYQDIVKTSNEQLMELSRHKNSANQKELTEAFGKMIAHLDEYKKAAQLSDQEKKPYETRYMVQEYLKVIREITAAEEQEH